MTDDVGWSDQGGVALLTVGCKLNQAETDSLAHDLLRKGYRVVTLNGAPRVIVLNTCTVTHIADRKCRRLMRLARRQNPGSLLIVMGCYAERALQESVTLPEADLMVGNADKDNISGIIDAIGGPGEHLGIGAGLPKTRAMVKIQDGCSRPCSFCIVPKVRGPEKSRAHDDVIRDIANRVAEGHREIVLTGTRIGYSDGRDGLSALIERILNETSIQRLRLSSLEPSDLVPELLELWTDSRLCRHLHLPLQSGSDSVLKRMRRSYSTRVYRRAVSTAREYIPDLSVTTDIMVGFPGETEAEFDESFRFCREIGFAGMHVFAYSPRPGTEASRMADGIPDLEKKKRSNLMLELASANGHEFRNAFIGKKMEVLFERRKDDQWLGLTNNYLRVSLRSQRQLANKLLPTSLIGLDGSYLQGELAS